MLGFVALNVCIPIIYYLSIFVWRSAVHPALWSSQLPALLLQCANRYSGATVVLCILYDVAAAAAMLCCVMYYMLLHVAGVVHVL